MPTAFLRHATSKLEKRQDLEQIATLGFRGEALASIAAVAKVELLTKTQEEKLGIRATVQGGGRVHTEAVGCPEGTTILVRDLFYNLPARLKFLKKTATEAAYAVDVVEKLALSHPEISFRLIKDNKSLLHTPGDGKLLSAVYAVLGREFASQVREVDYTYNNIRLTASLPALPILGPTGNCSIFSSTSGMSAADCVCRRCRKPIKMKLWWGGFLPVCWN